jgi:hypothetical protein
MWKGILMWIDARESDLEENSTLLPLGRGHGNPAAFSA